MILLIVSRDLLMYLPVQGHCFDRVLAAVFLHPSLLKDGEG